MSIGPLNLSDADLSGFEALPAGRYNAEVFEMKMDAVKNADGQGKMPAGTPMIKVQYRITDEPYENRRVFQTFVIPPADYDKSKAAKMKGNLVRFFVALGEDETTVMSEDFDPDFDDYIARQCVVVVGREPKKVNGQIVNGEFNNPVKGVKLAGSIAETSSENLL